VGFCGETEAEFQASCDLVERMRFKNLFCFKYSPRPKTAADRRLPDDVPAAVKRARLRALLLTQERVSLADNQEFVGQEVEVLVEGFSKAAVKAQDAEQSRGGEVGWRRADQLVGRTRGDRIVVFPGAEADIGQIRRVRVLSATALTLFGELTPLAADRTVVPEATDARGATEP